MKDKFYSVQGVGPAKATLAYTPHTERCRLCQCDIPKGTLSVVGTSFHPMLGYIGGWFHQVCWIHKNFTLANGRIIKMAKEKQLPLNIPELADIGELTELDLEYEYKQSDLVDKEIVVLEYKPIVTQYGDALIANCLIEGEEHKVLIGSMVLIKQLELVSDKLPLRGTIKRQKNYFTF